MNKTTQTLLVVGGLAAVLYWLSKNAPSFTPGPMMLPNAVTLPSLPQQVVTAPTPPTVNFVAATSATVGSGYTPDYSTFGIG